MDVDRGASPASSSSPSIAASRHRRHAAEEVAGDDPAVECTGKSCQSCTAGVIADCIALCCCPCVVVNIITLVFFKLPVAVTRRCISRRKRKLRRRRAVEEKKRGSDVISTNPRVEDGIVPEILLAFPEGLNDHFGAEFIKDDELWLELNGIRHLGFGRVSFTGIPFHSKGS